ncbi:LOW QUALITY PROTEIN: hypothetical protein PHMEG_0009603 [Phytophthora megakarya]|uniref:Uncharacterized protein n=1 Tax=Phytophthora megakarya TaxID=4795 RepID=A0A225WHH5_9STRA|nr:LOW QUALITY PROTEIN: hypothetical protein PHMEG_0009603 [Phytophthora megakarya]
MRMAHAEAYQRDLETSSSAAEAVRVSVQPDRDAALVSGPSDSVSGYHILVRAIGYSSRCCSTVQVRGRRLNTRAVRLENALALSQRSSRAEIARLEILIDSSDLASTEGTMTWRRLLRKARAGRESARLGCDALVARANDMMTAVGSSLNVNRRVRDLEIRVEASTYVTTPLPSDLDSEMGRAAATLSILPASVSSRPGEVSTAASSCSVTPRASRHCRRLRPRDASSPWCFFPVVVNSVPHYRSSMGPVLES